ncbi:MAG: IPT/TIG domain-containing protein [Armatimonadota bacterium]
MRLPASATTVYSTSFENFTPTNWQGWTASNGVWEFGVPLSGPNSAHEGSVCAATVLDGNYPLNQDSRLISPGMNLPSLSSGQEITLKFWQWFSFAGSTKPGTGYVQVQEWSGSAWGAWTTVSAIYGENSSGWKYTGTSYEPVDLTTYAGKRIRLGFFHSGGSIGAPGWYLDDMRVDVDAIYQDLPLNQQISFENFTATNWQGWAANNGVWEFGVPTSGPNSAHDGTACAATVLNGNYPQYQDSRLISPAMNLPLLAADHEINLKFWQWFSFAGSTKPGTGYVQVQEWSGHSWGSWTTVSAVYAENSTGWKYTGTSFEPVDLSTYAGKRIRLGFFNFGGSVGGPGWYVDDMRVDVEAIHQDLPLNQTVSFESFTATDWQGWAADNGVWEVGQPTSGPGSAHDGIQCAGTILGGNYPESRNTRLVTPAMNLPVDLSGFGISLKFWQWFIYEGSARPGTGYVQVSEWSGTAWGDWTTVSDIYGGDSNGWKYTGTSLAPVDLSTYAGKRIRIGFYHAGGSSDGPGWFIDNITIVAPSPNITSFNPTSGKIGTVVTIEGENFTGTTMVKFNGITADFTVASDFSITTSVPVGASTGYISVTAPGGTANSPSKFTVIPAPTITSFAPTIGKVGDSVTITGTNFTGATVVKMNGTTVVTFSVVSATSITATVPTGATTGKIAVTTPGGTATSTGDYTVIPAPVVSSFSPTTGKVGDSVTITGTNFTGATAVKINATAVVTFSVVSATSITATVPAGATTGKISVTTPGGTATSSGVFTVIPAPTISSFAPTSGKVGDSVTITGTNLTGATEVKFNGTAAATFSVVSVTSITATVPVGTATGKVSVATPGGTVTSTGDYTVYPAPTVTSFSPTSGKVGDSVTITGTNLTGATGVRFNGTAAVAYSVVSATCVTATVPVGATTGKISVTTLGGTASSTGDYIVYQAPTISSFTPTSGKVGDSVTITGTNFTGATAVKFNGTAAAIFSVVSATSITATVPGGTTTGKVSVITPGGTVTSTGDYTVVPVPSVTSFAPLSGTVGQVVTITGTNFTGTTSVNINGITATYTVVSAISITATVPSGATTGKISVTTPGGVGTSAANFAVYQPTSLTVTITPGVGYSVACSGIRLSYSLIGIRTYTGSLGLDDTGRAVIDGLEPGHYSLSITGSHWLKRKVIDVNVDGVNDVNTTLTNGDADGDNKVNLFDFVILDMHFGSSDTMADLDGNGQVNLFDYVIIDRNFGAQGD